MSGYSQKTSAAKVGTIVKAKKDQPAGPTDQEITEYAKWLGLDSSEKDLFWIAKQALSVPIPAPWVQCQTDDGDVFFHNTKTKESVWDHPYDGFYKQAVKRYKGGQLTKEQLTTTVSDPWLLEKQDSRESVNPLAVTTFSAVGLKREKELETQVAETRDADRSLGLPAASGHQTASEAPPSVIASSPDPENVTLNSASADAFDVLPTPRPEKVATETSPSNLPKVSPKSPSPGTASSPIPGSPKAAKSPKATLATAFSEAPVSPISQENPDFFETVSPTHLATGPVSPEQRVQSFRVSLESLRLDSLQLQREKESQASEILSLKSRAQEAERQLKDVLAAYAPVKEQLPEAERQLTRARVEIGSLEVKLREESKAKEAAEARAAIALKREAAALLLLEKKKMVINSKINGILDEDRGLKIKFRDTEEALKEEIRRLRDELDGLGDTIAIMSREGQSVQKGCFGGKRGGNKSVDDMMGPFTRRPVTTPTVPLNSRISELIAELKSSLEDF